MANLDTLTINELRELSPTKIAEMFDMRSITMRTNPTPLDYKSGATASIWSNNTEWKGYLKRNLDKGDCYLFGSTNAGDWKIIVAVMNGEVVKPGNLTIDHIKDFPTKREYSSLPRQVAQYNTQRILTKKLIPVISLDAIGQDVVETREGNYSDRFLAEISRTYSIHSILGENLTRLSEGDYTKLDGLVMNSPARNHEVEEILREFLVRGSEDEVWVGYKSRGSDGISLGTKVGLLHSVREGESNIIIPSQKFVEYMSDRCE